MSDATVDTNPRIAGLLGWEQRPSHATLCATTHDAPHGRARINFTTDLNLTVREIERRGWRPEIEYEGDGTYSGNVYTWPETWANSYRRMEKSAAEALAIAFLAALEGEADA